MPISKRTHAEPGPRHASPATRNHDVRLAPLTPIPALLRELGHDPVPVLAACGLPPDALDRRDRRLPYRVAGAVFDQAVRVSGREDFGLLLAQRFEIDDFGLLGSLLGRASTVGQALHDLYRYFHLHDRGGVVYLRRREGSLVALGYAIVEADTPGASLVHDLVMAIALRLMRGLAGAGFRAEEVCLARARPADGGPYRRYFAAPLQFDAPCSELRFDRAWLQAPVVGADPVAYLRELRLARSAEADLPFGMAERARAVAHQLLSDGEVSAPALASALGLHERTLRRRLAEEGTDIKGLIAAVRFELSKQLLRETRLPVDRIATALGYGDASAFLRAFRAWSGVTPGQWRETQCSVTGQAPPRPPPRPEAAVTASGQAEPPPRRLRRS
jgi:AraC-like DNA-binding protein